MPVREKSLPALARGFGRLYQTFRGEVGRQKRLFAGAGVTVALSVVFRLLEPWPLKFIYDLLFGALGHGRTRASWLTAGWSAAEVIAAGAAAMVAIAALAAAADYLNAVLLALAASRVLADIRLRLFGHIANLSMSFHNRSRTGDLTSRVMFDIDRIREVLVTSVVPFVSNGLALTAMLGVMFWMNWRLAAIAMVAFPVFLWVVAGLTRRIRETTRAQRQKEGAMAATATEVMGSIRVVQALSLERHFTRQFAVSNARSLRMGVETQRLSARLERTAELLAASAGALVLWAGAHAVLDKTITPGELIVFLSYLRTAFRPLRQLAKYVGQMAKAVASGDRILDVLHTEAEVTDREGAVEAPALAGHIRFDNVSFEYEPGKPVLEGVSFEARPGERVAIVGDSGSGKSTLASLLMRFHDVTGGRILLDGTEVEQYTIGSLRRQVSVVMQESVLFAASVRENIALGVGSAGTEAVEAAARTANAHEFIERMPRGYETELGERGATVSGGQRQRIAIARAAIRNSPIVVLDEPTTGLDEAGAREVEAGLERLWRGRTTILITHDLEAARGADVVLYLRRGRVVERGSFEELVARGGEFAGLYGKRRRGGRETEGEERMMALNV